MEKLEKNNVTQKLEENSVSLKFVQEAIDNFEKATTNFNAKIENVMQNDNPMELRILNDQIMHLERMFLLPEGKNCHNE